MTGKRSGILANSVLMTLGLVSANALMLTTDLGLIWGYGPQLHGQVTLALSVAALGAILCDIGLASKAGVRLIAQLRGKAGDGLGEAVGRLGTILLTVATLAAGVIWLGSGPLFDRLGIDTSVAGHVACWLLAVSVMRVGTMVFIGFERLAFVAAVITFGEVLRLGWLGVCLAAGWGLDPLYWGWSVSASGTGLLSLLIAYRLLSREGVRIRLRGGSRLLIDAVRGLPYLVPMLSAQALSPLTFLLVGIVLAAGPSSEATISVLKVCFSLAMIMRVVSQAIATSLFPVVARRSARDDADAPESSRIDSELLSTAAHGVRVMAFIASTMLVGFVVLGGLGLSWLDALGGGEGAYSAGLSALLLLTIAIGADCYRVQVDQLLMGSGRPGGVAVGEAVKLVFLLILIPVGVHLWPEDAVLAVAGAILVALLGSALGRGVWGWWKLGGAAAGPAWRGLAVMLAVTASYALGGAWVALPLWAVGVLALGLVARSDMALLGQVVRRVKT